MATYFLSVHAENVYNSSPERVSLPLDQEHHSYYYEFELNSYPKTGLGRHP